jgi:biotin synthase
MEWTSGEIEARLRATGPDRNRAHAAAAEVRDREFGATVFVRGVVEVSNFCRENCAYCGMRRDNRSLDRFRLERDEILDLLLHRRPASITDINFQTGEDPVAVREVVIPVIRELAAQTDLGISVCLGTLSPNEYRALKEAGASLYIIKLETGDPAHYAEMRAPGNVEERLEAIRHLASEGWEVSSGFILGLPGQTPAMAAATLQTLAALPLSGCSVSPFIPGDDTPLAGATPGDLDATLDCIALMREMHPSRIIPAVSALTLVGESGYTRALRAGANLATINLTPSRRRGDYLLYKRDRNIMTEERVLAEIAAAGCVPGRESLVRHLALRAARAAAA